METAVNIETAASEFAQNRDNYSFKCGEEKKFFNALKEKYAVPFVYSSLSLSGTAVTKQTVKNVIENGFAESEDETAAGNEILEQYDAYERIFQFIDKQEITEDNIKFLHKTLHSRTPDFVAGKYPEGKNKVIALKMKKFLEWFNSDDSEENIMRFAAKAYHEYIYIHPFKGGNGKMARLIMNLGVLRRKFTPVIIPADVKPEYDRLIKESKELTEDFTNFIAKCALSSQSILFKSEKDTYSAHKKRHLRNVDCSETVLKAIQENPGIKIMQIKEFVQQVSFIKLQRTIGTLRKQGLVEFRGPLRSGGYFHIEKSE
ncbi:MAG: Fic family protein [Bacteroidales bacterium]|nr:Fic family protein [Bacteroidales bacterium]MBQ5540398.1 Fic family protein [Bacteroidales bacterium]MEE3447551.1 Fic family protein [Bacteroidales bacterium]